MHWIAFFLFWLFCIIYIKILKANIQFRIFFFLTCPFFSQWGAAYCVRGGPHKERAAMEVCSICSCTFWLLMQVTTCWIVGERMVLRLPAYHYFYNWFLKLQFWRAFSLFCSTWRGENASMIKRLLWTFIRYSILWFYGSRMPEMQVLGVNECQFHHILTPRCRDTKVLKSTLYISFILQFNCL